MGRRKDRDPVWQDIRLRYEMGDSPTAIARDTGKRRTAILMRAKRDGWRRVTGKQTPAPKQFVADVKRRLETVKPHLAEVLPLPKPAGELADGCTWADAEARHKNALVRAWTATLGLYDEVLACEELYPHQKSNAITDLNNSIAKLAIVERQVYADDILWEQRSRAAAEQEIVDKGTHDRLVAFLSARDKADTPTMKTGNRSK